MGKNDIYMKSYLSDKARFTDLFNCIVGQGEELFSVDGMRELNGAAELVVTEGPEKEHGIQRYRDIIMQTKKRRNIDPACDRESRGNPLCYANSKYVV